MCCGVCSAPCPAEHVVINPQPQNVPWLSLGSVTCPRCSLGSGVVPPQAAVPLATAALSAEASAPLARPG